MILLGEHYHRALVWVRRVRFDVGIWLDTLPLLAIVRLV